MSGGRVSEGSFCSALYGLLPLLRCMGYCPSATAAASTAGMRAHCPVSNAVRNGATSESEISQSLERVTRSACTRGDNQRLQINI